MKKRRDACKEAIEILQKAMGAANDEKANLQISKFDYDSSIYSFHDKWHRFSLFP